MTLTYLKPHPFHNFKDKIMALSEQERNWWKLEIINEENDIVLQNYPESVIDDEDLVCLAVERHAFNFDDCSDRIKSDPAMIAYRDLAFSAHYAKPFHPSELDTQELRDAYTITSLMHNDKSTRAFREDFVANYQTVVQTRVAAATASPSPHPAAGMAPVIIDADPFDNTLSR